MKAIKGFIIAVLGITMLAACNSEAEKELSYRNGVFEIHDTVLGYEYRIIRSDSIQKEYALSFDDSSTYAVEWLSDSLYTLRMTEGPLPMLQHFEGKTLTVEIKEIHHDYLRVQTYLSNDPDTANITMHRIYEEEE